MLCLHYRVRRNSDVEIACLQFSESLPSRILRKWVLSWKLGTLTLIVAASFEACWISIRNRFVAAASRIKSEICMLVDHRASPCTSKNFIDSGWAELGNSFRRRVSRYDSGCWVCSRKATTSSLSGIGMTSLSEFVVVKEKWPFRFSLSLAVSRSSFKRCSTVDDGRIVLLDAILHCIEDVGWSPLVATFRNRAGARARGWPCQCTWCGLKALVRRLITGLEAMSNVTASQNFPRSAVTKICHTTNMTCRDDQGCFDCDNAYWYFGVPMSALRCRLPRLLISRRQRLLLRSRRVHRLLDHSMTK